MKKGLILLILLLVGCSNSSYNSFVEKANKSIESDSMPFKVEFYIDDSDSLMVYQVVIDDAEYELDNVKAIVIHNVKTDNIFPSIGVVEDTINLDSNTKGINLVGYVEKQDVQFKVYVEIADKSYTYIYNYEAN